MVAPNARAQSVVSSNVDTVYTFLRLLEEKDIDAWIELWADHADHYYPFGIHMFPHHLAGKAAIYDRWKNTPGMFETLAFPVQETWVDGDTVIARFESDSILKGGRRYLNNYISIFKFDDAGKIREYWEYFDPIIAGEDFKLSETRYLNST
jgi:ketosteroid isomerase-like protein